MREAIKKEFAEKALFVFFFLLTVWWITLQFMYLPKDSNYNQLFAAVYGLITLWGGIYGIIIAKKWGGIRSIMGKSILLFSLGLLFQEIGQLAYSYYIYFLKIPVPYPSVGDYFFYGTIPVYILAVLYLARASGVHFSLRSVTSKLQAIIIPLAMLSLSYFIFLRGYEVDRSAPIKTLIDFGAPLGQAIYISLAILTYTLTRGMLGGLMKSKVLLILFALVAQFAADWTFIYQASRGIWYAGGTNDYMFLFAYFMMSLGLLQLGTTYNKLRH